MPRIRLLPLLAFASGCTLEPLAQREQFDARGFFQTVVQPQLVRTCAACHASREPFLETDREYEAITGYKGGLFLTQPPEISYLLHRGQHQGPALTDEQAADVLAWLRQEVRQLEQPLQITPTVSAAPGEYFLSLKALVGDPQAHLTFQIESLARSPGDLLLSNLQIVAGPEAGLQLRHPRFIVTSAAGAVSDPADSLSNVELTLNPREKRPLGPGGLILTSVPPIASLAVAFVSISRVGEQKMTRCKALSVFHAKVRPTLDTPCAMRCHGGSNSVATNAFNLRAVTSGDPAEQARLCVETLARINPMNVPQSVLLRQITPEAQGGTRNHPFKLSDPSPLRQAITEWVVAEGM